LWDDVNDPVANLPKEPSERALAFRNGLISEATGSSMDGNVYRLLRAEFMADPSTTLLLPQFVRTCADTGDFWQFIKYEFGSYRERRDYLSREFQPLINSLERNEAPVVGYVSATLQKFDTDGVASAWNKALQRSTNDPEGAVTAARTLLETVCKHILDDFASGAGAASYGSYDDLPKLYGSVAKALNLAPSQHTEDVFKQILGGAFGVVQGIGALRNRVGDAHGQGRRSVKIQSRHAALAVNLAGTMATYLVETHVARASNNVVDP
jgi:hypothetical protein